MLRGDHHLLRSLRLDHEGHLKGRRVCRPGCEVVRALCEVTPPIRKLVLFEQSLIHIEDEEHLLQACFELSQIVSRKGHVLGAQLLCGDDIPLLLDRETAHTIVEPVEGFFVVAQGILTELDRAAERLGQMGSLEDMSSLY